MKTVNKIKNTCAVTTAPPSKAHTLRAMIIGSLAEGQTIINNPLLGQDQLNVIDCLKKLGVKITIAPNKITIQGSAGRYEPTGDILDVGESGVGMNFLTSAACLAAKPIIITGSKRITERPVNEVVDGLRQLGCKIECLEKEGFLPVKILGGGVPGGTAAIKGRQTSQYFSSLTISAPLAKKQVTLKCVDEMTERPYYDITLQMMAEFGAAASNNDYKEITIPTGKYTGKELPIEGDYSSASFFFLAAAITNSCVTVNGLRSDSCQGDKIFVDLIEKMGCEISRSDSAIIVQGRGLSPITQDMSDVPDLVPPMAIAAGFADGTSELTNIGHLRLKECDRLAVMASELNKMGISVNCTNNSLIIEGNSENAHGTTIETHNDHRIAMSFAIAGLVTGSQIIENPGCVAKSFPDFWERFEIFAK
ncbi:MAG: 3-phosphoshikimate 1-carboxyvinyltransferase [Anaerohalosphaeraceae bacterium]|nr:3-phosphoshikimate 1-carboxyvinyltransferase [Anaerohalosphaeraceae bacterium]